MPSPFPGMDPYLEQPSRWPDLHHELISEIRAELNRLLRPRYFATVEERVYLSDENDPARGIFVPDVHLFARSLKSSRSPMHGRANSATIEPYEVTTVVEDEIHEARIEIVDTNKRSIVTVIEILSPTNKMKGSYGRENYQHKRRQILCSQSHLVEIDLLRSGIRIPIREQLPPYDYLIHVARAIELQQRRSLAWPIPITEPLPTISIPLKGSDPDVNIDMQQIFASAYDRGAFDLKIDYTGDPDPPLAPQQTEWARQIITETTKI
jgi:hypothetical protein